MDLYLLIVLLYITVAMISVVSVRNQSQNLKERTANLKAIPDFRADQFDFGENTGIAIDKAQSRLNLFQINRDNSFC